MITSERNEKSDRNYIMSCDDVQYFYCTRQSNEIYMYILTLST